MTAIQRPTSEDIKRAYIEARMEVEMDLIEYRMRKDSILFSELAHAGE